MNYLKITDIEAYNIFFELSNQVWDIVLPWNYLAQKTIESFDWLEKSIKRNLIDQKQYSYLRKELEKLPKSINGLIKFTDSKLTI